MIFHILRKIRKRKMYYISVEQFRPTPKEHESLRLSLKLPLRERVLQFVWREDFTDGRIKYFKSMEKAKMFVDYNIGFFKNDEYDYECRIVKAD